MATSSPEFWQALYDAETRPEWSLRGPSPLLAEVLDLAPGLAPGAAVAVPGCGYGHDVAELARRGFQATGLDFAANAIQTARDLHGDLAQWRQEDWLAPAEPSFDAIFDYTCFVAMDPELREPYVEACARHLLPGGLWLGGFFHTVTTGDGPPFPVSMAELRALAEVYFEVLYLEPATRSHPRRAGREFVLVARKR